MGPSTNRHERTLNLFGLFGAAAIAPIGLDTTLIVQTLPPGNGVGLLAAGILLLALEAHLFTFGALGALGIAAFSAGLLIWYAAGGVSLAFACATIAVFVLIAVGLIVIGYRTRRMRFGRGVESLVGREGRVVEVREAGGMISVHGELWSFESLDGNLNVGDKVEVVNQTHLLLSVKRSL